jgi:hypothetical protein
VLVESLREPVVLSHPVRFLPRDLSLKQTGETTPA